MDDSDSAMEEFDDGLDENLIRDEEDRKRLDQMTEKEREQELFNRIEKREVLRTRWRKYFRDTHIIKLRSFTFIVSLVI